MAARLALWLVARSHLLRALAGILLAVPVFSAHADFGRPATYYFNGSPYPTAQAACLAYDPSYTRPAGVEPRVTADRVVNTTVCLTEIGSAFPASVNSVCEDIPNRQRLNRTPGPIAFGAVTLGADVCNYAGTDPGSGSTDQCEANDGKLTTANYTLGWARGPEVDKDDYIGALKFPDTQRAACVNGCRASFAENQTGDAYRSQAPTSQGLYRISSDYTMVGGNIPCTAGPEDAPFDPKTPNMQCPGYVGEVNGKTVCVGNADKPIPPAEKPGVKDKTGKGEDKGNPKAGQKPGSGEGSGNGGSGRTPSTGDGGNGGGPAGAVGGGGGTGEGEGEGEGDKDKKGCGLPGQPKCAIDETGTPDGKSAYGELNGKLDGLDAQRKTGTDKITGTGDKDTSWGTSWSWFVNGQCRPISLGILPIGTGVEMRIDICPIVPYTNLVLNFLWAVGTFIAILSMVFRVTTKGD